MAFELAKLGYNFNALEPYIDARTMEIHHDKHHAGYTNNYKRKNQPKIYCPDTFVTTTCLT